MQGLQLGQRVADLLTGVLRQRGQAAAQRRQLQRGVHGAAGAGAHGRPQKRFGLSHLVLQVLTPVTKSPSHQVTKSPSHQVTKSPSHQVTKSPSHQVTKSPSHQVTKSPSHKLQKSREKRRERYGKIVKREENRAH